MSADAARVIAQYDGQTDLRSGSREVLKRAQDFPGVTPEQKGQLERILSTARAASAAKAKETAEPQRDIHAERMQQFADQEASIQARELTADLNVALTAAGSSGQELEDARALLDRDLAGSRDPQTIRDGVDVLKARMPSLFGAEQAPEVKKTKGRLPGGKGGKRNRPPATQPGAAGLAHARQRGWTTD